MTQIKIKKRQGISEKKDYLVRRFTSVLTITETMTYKSSVYVFTGNVKPY